MADNRGVSETPAIRAEDLLSVRSRISWGPIFAGAALALALFFLLALLGGALGLSISGQVRGDNIATGAADDGFDLEAVAALSRNLAHHNGDLGIEAEPEVIDGGGNTAFLNGNPLQCVGVLCAP